MMSNRSRISNDVQGSAASGALLRMLAILDLVSVPSLRSIRADDLIEEAQRRTGFSNLGEIDVIEPLTVWLESINEEPRLRTMARILARRRAVVSICNRLMFAEAFAIEPSILARPIERPLIIASLPRTGTTVLHRLLSQDPRARPLFGWESLDPIVRKPRLRHGVDTRLLRARRLSRAAQALAPRLRAIHEFNPEQPDECGLLMRNTFVGPMDRLLLERYGKWYDAQPASRITASYREYREQLQFLQWERPVPADGHWVLKSPIHSYAIEAIGDVFPDATIVLIHRDPAKFVPSFCSITSFFFDLLLKGGSLDRQALANRVVDWCVDGLRRTESARQKGVKAHIVDVRYSELVRDPVGTIRAIYEEGDYFWHHSFEARLRAWVAAHPQGKYGRHIHRPEQFGITPAVLASRFGWYRERYSIQGE
jgi:hypothetical protein